MYKIDRNNPLTNMKCNINNYFGKTKYCVAGFVICGVAAGTIFGTIYNMNLGASKDAIVSTGGGDLPILFTVASVFFAREAYKNYKKEKKRWDELTIAYDNRAKEKPQIQEKRETLDEINERLTREEELRNRGPQIYIVNENTVDDSDGNGYSKVLMPK